jgi:radical SAM superfamily enzyme YgiQ (UPF0313 family)/predicted AAA+ superfamily ATPase
LREEKRILAINSPTLDEGGFRGSPTSMLYAIGPLIEEIKARPKRINISGFSQLNIFDPTIAREDLLDQLGKKLQEIEPHIVVISTTSDSFHIAEKMANLVKAHPLSKNTIIILGGPHCDEVDFDEENDPNNPLISSSSFDFVIRGDGEYMLLGLIKTVLNGMEVSEGKREKPNVEIIKKYVKKNARTFARIEGRANLYFKINGNTQNLQSSMREIDLDNLPPLRYEYLKKDHLYNFGIFENKYTHQTEKCVQVLTHRGCTGQCDFCSEGIHHFGEVKGYYNPKRVDTVISEIQHYVTELGVEAVFFDDSTFLEDSTYVRDLCKQMIESGLSRRIRWGCLNRFVKVNDPDLIKYMAEAGLDYMYLGLELYDDDSLSEMNKGNTKVIRDALEILSDNEIRVGVSILFGYPLTTEDVEKETIRFVGQMVDEKKIHLVSLSLFNYHLASLISLKHRGKIRLDYFNVEKNVEKQNSAPWSCFEEGGWFHAGNRQVDESYLARILWEVNRSIKDKNVLVRKAELETFIKSSWAQKLLKEPIAFSLIRNLSKINLSDYIVVGHYVRFDENVRNSLRDVCKKILSGLSEKDVQHWLFWGESGAGKTSLVEQIGEKAKRQGIAFRRFDLSNTKLKRSDFGWTIRELEEGNPALFFVDEITAKSEENWPYETIKSFLDTVAEKSLPITLLLAGSAGTNIDDLKKLIGDRHMGTDMLRRIPNECSIPEMSLGDRVIIALNSFRRAGKRTNKEIKNVEKLALHWMALSPKLESAGQLHDFATNAVKRMPSREHNLMYEHLFNSSDPEKTRFENELKRTNHMTHLRKLVNMSD